MTPNLERNLLWPNTMPTDTHESAPKSQPQTRKARGAPLAALGRVLVATEDPGTAGAIGGWLTAAGYEVVVAADAMAARAMAGSFDCGVFSLELPDGNGVVLAAHLTAQDKLSTVVFCPERIHQTDEDDLPTTEEIEKLVGVEASVAAAMAEIRHRPNAAAA
jgi:CheY-like chemotaxis protein